MQKEFTCIVCPNGCEITAALKDDGAADTAGISGAGCRRGIDYVLQELNDPRRTIATTVAVAGSSRPILSVRTRGSIPLARVKEAAAQIHAYTAKAPVRMGDVLISSLLGLQCDVIATCDAPEAGEDTLCRP